MWSKIHTFFEIGSLKKIYKTNDNLGDNNHLQNFKVALQEKIIRLLQLVHKYYFIIYNIYM